MVMTDIQVMSQQGVTADVKSDMSCPRDPIYLTASIYYSSMFCGFM
jgi:hypothetical protein